MTRKRDWMIPGSLLLLGLLPILTGALSLVAVHDGITQDVVVEGAETYVKHPFPIVTHIILGAIFNLLGPFQFVPAIRRRWPRVHRIMGRTFLMSGVLVVLGAIWMNQFFPAYGGILKYSSVLIFGIAMIVTMILALRAILRRDIVNHRKWMIRTFAIGLGVSTQRLLFLPYFALFGMPEGIVLSGLMWLGWIITIAVAEWWLHRTKDTPAAYGLAS